MKSKIMIPALLLSVVMIAGAFAFMPVQEASTVHTSGDTKTVNDVKITSILTATETTIPSTLTTISSYIDGEIGTPTVSLKIDHDDIDTAVGLLPSTTDVSDMGTANVLTAPGTLLTAASDGVAYVTCSNHTIATSTDTLTIDGNVFADIANNYWVIAVSATDVIAWVQTSADDTATCTAILLS